MEFEELSNIDPRGFWRHEAHDFTPWLYENLERLGRALGLQIEATKQEQAIGEFSLDILAVDLESKRPVIIENQLEATDHDHLGKLLTYAGGTDAAIVIWVSTELREEHRQALEWLNSKTIEGVDFFAVVLEVVKIGNSKPAVLFKPVVRPNEWQKQTMKAAQAGQSEKGEKYRRFYQPLLDELRERHHFTNAKVAQPQCWYAFSSGNSSFNYSANFTGKGTVRAEVYIDCEDRETNNRFFDELHAQREAIEKEFGEPLEWQRLDEKRACRICIHRSGAVEDSDERLEEIRAWLIQRLLKIKQVFAARIASLR
jgi:hypothetical protein